MLPGLLKFDGDCLIVLRETLLAVRPEEGCALLIGERFLAHSPTKKIFLVKHIWPCCNIWGSIDFTLFSRSGVVKQDKKEGSPSTNSKNNRFAIDPREQILAQKWARSKKMIVLGTAHSHPSGEGKPSLTDLEFGSSYEVMIILGRSGTINCWEIPDKQNVLPVELENINYH